MDRKKFSRIIKNPRHISGIHNYCDRWCERCPLTLRCSTFAMEAMMDKKQPPHDRAMESVWPRLQQCEPLAAELLKKHADHAGVGIPDDPLFKNMRQTLDSNRAGAAATRYMEFAHKFVNKHQARFRQFTPPPGTPARYRPQPAAALLTPADPKLPPVTADEAYDIICWHHLFISVKLARALKRDELDEELDNDPELAGMPRDSDGSAKIALIAIDRSITAWAVLSLHLPEFAEPALNAMLTLDRLRRAVEKEVPNARLFVRPGFDTVRFTK